MVTKLSLIYNLFDHTVLIILCCSNWPLFDTLLDVCFVGLANMKLSKLRTLWLDGCAVTIESVLSLSAYRCNNLTYLSVRKLLAVTDNLEEEIQAADVVDPD